MLHAYWSVKALNVTFVCQAVEYALQSVHRDMHALSPPLILGLHLYYTQEFGC